MREELKRIKNEKEAEIKRLDEQGAIVFEKRRHAPAKFNPMVRRLLDELGLAMWGKGKYQVGQFWKDTTAWIVRSVPFYSNRYERWSYGGFSVKLCFDIEGNPSHFLIPIVQYGDLGYAIISCQSVDFGKKVGISESELETALVECFKVGPMDCYCSSEPPSLI